MYILSWILLLSFTGFALAALLSYKNLQSSVNQYFDELTGHEKDGVNPTFQISSRVVSVVVSNPSTQNLRRPVNITLRHLQVVPLDPQPSGVDPLLAELLSIIIVKTVSSTGILRTYSLLLTWWFCFVHRTWRSPMRSATSVHTGVIKGPGPQMAAINNTPMPHTLCVNVNIWAALLC